MRILMFLESYFPPDIRVEKEARTLLKGGHEVFLLCPNRDDGISEEVVEGIKVFRVPFPSDLLKRIWNFCWFTLFLVNPFWREQLAHIVKQERIEAIHIHDLPMVKTGLSVARKFDIPLVADLHENYPNAIKVWSINWNWRRLLVIRIQRWEQVERFCVRRADKVITVVDEAKEHYVTDCGSPPEKVTVVMNAEDPEYFCSLPVDNEIINKYEHHFTISYIGGFGPHRGVQTAISAMPKILQAIPNARLLLVGSGQNEIELKQLANDNGVEEAIEFTGWQPFSLVPSYFTASKVCLVPHIASGHTNTTIPHKLFQCMAIGKPVIVSSAKPLERIVSETGAGLAYPSDDADGLAQEIVRVYRDDVLAIRLGEAGRKAVKEKYNWEIEGEKLLALYRDLR